MADLTRNNPPPQPQPQPQPWPPLQIPIHQLSFTYMHTPHHQFSCMAQIPPFFPRLSLNFFKHPSIFPVSAQGSTAPPPSPPGFASTTPYADIYRLYGAGTCFFGPYSCLYLLPLQLQLKVYGVLQTRTSREQQRQQNRVSPSQPRIVELENRGTGVFHPPDINHASRNKKRPRKRGMRNENGAVQETGERSTNSWEEDGLELEQQLEEGPHEPNYDMVLPSEWPY